MYDPDNHKKDMVEREVKLGQAQAFRKKEERGFVAAGVDRREE